MKTLFEDSEIKIFMNNSKEIFILNKGNQNTSNNKTCIRVFKNNNGLIVTADFHEYIPISFDGLPGFSIFAK